MHITRLHLTTVGLAVVVVGLVAVALRPGTETVDLATVARGPLQVTVDDEGRTRVHDRFVVSAPVAGRVLRLALEPGDRVKRGDVIARLRPEMAPLLDARARAEAEAAINTAKAVLGGARAEEAQSAAALAHAQRERKRSGDLSAEGLISTQELEARDAEARLLTDAAKAATFAVEAAEADLHRAEARLAPAPIRLSGAPIDVRSPSTGVVLRRLRESESTVPAGDPLLEIGDFSRLEIVVDLLSSDAARVTPGARATVEQPGASPLTAKVQRIEPAGFTKVSALGVEEQRVNVIVELDGAAGTGTLGDAYRVDVRIVVWETASTLVVPATALFREGDRWATFTIADGRARRTAVEIGHRGGRQVEVLGGLAAGAQVVLHPGDRIADGVRVAERTK